ncbi:DEAD/DEAH box helicase [Pseudobacteriovorax antillogorgiicola]|uniref:ATP dependent helicase, Lhr family n=1 Tax=Pseudobacteriovorax antillogorgiicola TaxID=1513793 RepID=A0A1Y6BVG5_9BACT|nr:DEAD/DEAH box helicase [Pseudobacteriovorax antillogorgiicola]TCS53788.1 Lhr family ATP dependent helicase [Pseudobacteriovorax antillogorgiicola]SMF22238.1 ATP dependent helicase, Lhr family [Pseudobacteriovorax antillogorgiicola]
MDGFHPIVEEWFRGRFQGPTPPQQEGWPSLQADQHTLIAAPTGSGKTMAAFLVAIDRLIRQGIAGSLASGLQVVYVSPLRALSNDVKHNLEEPLQQITELVKEKFQRSIDIKVGLRTGDSSAYERSRLLKDPPHILVTTPESLYLLLTSDRGRAMLKPCRTMIVDEIHALARDKRGSHLSLSIERLDHLTEGPLTRVGLSATMKPMEDIARFLTGQSPCHIVNESSKRQLDMAVDLPATALSAICSHDQWAEVFERLSDQIKQHRSTLIFVNTRRMAERVTFHLSEILGEDAVTSHHGSLSKEARHKAEQRLKSGELKAIVATASLELGIDVGYIDLVCQVGSPRSIGVFMQRIGRSGHALGLVPKGRLFALTRDELVECYALMKACQAGDLDRIEIPVAPLDILAQQIVAMCSAEDWQTDSLLALIRRSWVYRNLSKCQFDKVLHILANGISDRNRKGSYLHYDQVNQKLKARRHARLSALTSGGAIPEQNLYRVVTGENGTFVGTLDEEFAVESSRGDIFLLGNTSWRVEAVRQGQVVVHDAGGAPPTIPFWFGEAPGRSFELSQHVSELRQELDQHLNVDDSDDPAWNLESNDVPKGWQQAQGYLQGICSDDPWGQKQILHYCASQKLATGSLPTQEKVLFERFFDDTGGMQLVVHGPFGTRINRAWGLAFRKRFCRGFDFELQASADDNGIVLSVGPNQSFPIDALFSMLNAKNCRDLLIQALLDVPMFQIRWRWNITRALAILRFKGGKRVPPHLQRYQSDDLLTAVFPQQTQCFEHRTGDLEVPDHPYVEQTVIDCLTEAMDITRFESIMEAKDDGHIQFQGMDTREPSPFSYELIHANPYAFLDDAPLEERRTRAVFTRRTLDPKDLESLAALDPEAIAKVRQEAWPMVRSPDELHDGLYHLVVLGMHELEGWQSYLEPLLDQKRIQIFSYEEQDYICCTENLMIAKALYDPDNQLDHSHVPAHLRRDVEWGEALKTLIKGHMEVRGPVAIDYLQDCLGIAGSHILSALQALESDGLVLSGGFTGQNLESREWCERRLLARIHRLTIEGLRKQIRPASPKQYIKFLIEHHHIAETSKLSEESGVLRVIQMLMGFEVPCSSWESELLPARVRSYGTSCLDKLCFNGLIAWGRLRPPARKEEQKGKGSLLSRVMPISIFPRSHMPWLIPPDRLSHEGQLSGDGSMVYEAIQKLGAPFYEDLVHELAMPRSRIEEALGELISLGLASADGFEAIRPLIAPDRKRKADLVKRSRRQLLFETGFQRGGRWSAFPGSNPIAEVNHEERLENWAWLLLERYGIIFRDLLSRERLAPQWRDLVRIYRKLEMRGEIRGGRFVKNVSGEQFALPEAVDHLRQAAKQPNRWVVLSACDPINLVGILDENPKIPAVPGNRVVFEDGDLIAYRDAGEVHFLKKLGFEAEEMIKRAIKLNGRYRQQDPFIREFLDRPQDQSPASKSFSKAEGQHHSHLNWSDIVKPSH